MIGPSIKLSDILGLKTPITPAEVGTILESIIEQAKNANELQYLFQSDDVRSIILELFARTTTFGRLLVIEQLRRLKHCILESGLIGQYPEIIKQHDIMTNELKNLIQLMM